MAKKTQGHKLTPAQMVRPQVVAEDKAVVQAEGKQSLREEYRYVVADLQRIGIIAVVMVVVMVVLVFVLT